MTTSAQLNARYRQSIFRQLQVLSVVICIVLGHFLYLEDKATFGNTLVLLISALAFFVILIASYAPIKETWLYQCGCWLTVFLIGFFLFDYGVVSSPALPWIGAVPSLLIFFMGDRQAKRTASFVTLGIVAVILISLNKNEMASTHTPQRDTLLLVSSLCAFSYAFFISFALWNLNRKEKIALFSQSEMDELTGVMNRRAFNRRLDRRLSQSRTEASGLGIAILDIDNFKSINDNFGHVVGDEILKLVSQAIRQAVRETDVVARYGGEEFIILLNVNSNDEISSLSERVLSNVRNIQYTANGNTIQVTLSGGAVFDTRPQRAHIKDMVEAADKNLYRAKRSGKDQFVFCTE
ncbi:MAG: hypothetical protein Alis3KO_16000 [Aliiglaciecola sp.]|uniref:GGDEF domain-containing protein n=1 Tax=Aliiglaciecola sp. M165 TaxID=2593649 RepID=UPI00117EA224|nr:GGDEF domain-containing protein [Aliiglaciecola sp. M165]TRY31454.1 GGDEF domain-containing protein [Aliiglaciecola sp. M165]